MINDVFHDNKIKVPPAQSMINKVEKKRRKANQSYEPRRQPAKLKPSGLCSKCTKKCEVYTQSYAKVIECVYDR